MKIVILDGFDNESLMQNVIKDTLDNKTFTYNYFKLCDYKISPCSSCASCNEKTPGRCTINVEHESIIKEIANCDLLVFLTPIRYGAYSSTLKKIIDRFMLIGTPLYTVKKGFLLHKMRYTLKGMLTIGEIDKTLHYSYKSIKSFELLSNRNALNMNLKVDTFVYDAKDATHNLKSNFVHFMNNSDLLSDYNEVKYD